LVWAVVACTGETPNAAITARFVAGNHIGGERNKHVFGAGFPAQTTCDNSAAFSTEIAAL
jgi:hypothetical protein